MDFLVPPMHMKVAKVDAYDELWCYLYETNVLEYINHDLPPVWTTLGFRLDFQTSILGKGRHRNGAILVGACRSIIRPIPYVSNCEFWHSKFSKVENYDHLMEDKVLRGDYELIQRVCRDFPVPLGRHIRFFDGDFRLSYCVWIFGVPMHVKVAKVDAYDGLWGYPCGDTCC